MTAHKWFNEAGDTVVAAAWNQEYTLYIDFELGIQVDNSPNHEDIRWSTFLTPRSYEDVVQEYVLQEEEGRVDSWLQAEMGHMTLQQAREHIRQKFIRTLDF